MSLLPTVSDSGGNSNRRDNGDSQPMDDAHEHSAPPVITSATGLGTQQSASQILRNTDLSETDATEEKLNPEASREN